MPDKSAEIAEKTNEHEFDDTKSWVYGGRFKEDDIVYVKHAIRVQQDALVKFKDIFLNKPIPKRLITIRPNDKLIVISTPLEHLGGGLHGSYYPLTYTLKMVDGKNIIAVPESILATKPTDRVS